MTGGSGRRSAASLRDTERALHQLHWNFTSLDIHDEIGMIVTKSPALG